ncbi:ribosome biogenesis protein TSR3, putative [Plasmodium sp. DRC-Itaito]|nr:ribosome biogenesis protein TSR3, putative [Plasmodium sp. DRC-Itaito]
MNKIKMKNNYIERKKYSIHNLVKLINEKKNIENGKKNELSSEGTTKNKNVSIESNDVHINSKKKKKKNKTDKKNGHITNEDFVSSSSDDENEYTNNEKEIINDQDELSINDENKLCNDHEIINNGSSDDNEIKLFMFDYKECQNKKCSCKKLYRFKKIKKVQMNKKFKGIVLTPFCEKYFSIDDKYTIENYGLSVVDCSWKSIDLLKRIKFSNQRKLPYIIAVNSINYGKPYKLSCLESLAFCLYVCNYNKQCNDILNIYKWSVNFTNLNKELLDSYKLCNTHEEIKNAEEEFIQKYIHEKEQNKKIDEYKIIYEDDYI